MCTISTGFKETRSLLLYNKTYKADLFDSKYSLFDIKNITTKFQRVATLPMPVPEEVSGELELSG